MEPARPRLGVSFTRWSGKDYVILTWEPGGKPALTMEAVLPLDDERRRLIEKSITTFLLGLGFPVEMQKNEAG